MDETEVARALEELSTNELLSAARADRLPSLARRPLELLARFPSKRLGRLLARFDHEVGTRGLATAARDVMQGLGAQVRVEGEPPRAGAALVVTNHPGAYDALATMAALARDDVALVAAERPFLRAMPHVSEHLVFVAEDGAAARAAGLRRAVDWLAAGHVLVQFGAGAIEPDARFDRAGDLLGEWQAGTGLLVARAAKLGAPVIPAFVDGVHSARAKRLPFVRFAERRGVTTLAPLVQATMPGFDDVDVCVRFGDALESVQSARDARARTALVRAAALALFNRR